jgi:hypothetical protein
VSGRAEIAVGDEEGRGGREGAKEPHSLGSIGQCVGSKKKVTSAPRRRTVCKYLTSWVPEEWVWLQAGRDGHWRVRSSVDLGDSVPANSPISDIGHGGAR